MTIRHHRSHGGSRLVALTLALALSLTGGQLAFATASAADAVATTVTVNDSFGTSEVGLIYTGSWRTSTGSGKYNGDDHYSDVRDSAISVAFSGTGAEFYGARAAWHGIAAFSVDGGAETRVDLYSAIRQDQTLMFSVGPLSAGAHLITARVTGDRSASASGSVLAFDRVVVSRPAATAAPSTAGFVTRSGNQLKLGGATFRFTGANLYWLGLDDNITVNGLPTYPTKARIDNALGAAVASGFTVIRAHTLGISVGCSRCLEPSRGTFNDAALQSADYAIYRAGLLGLKIVIPLVDQWRWYHGGISTFTGWRGYPNAGSSTDNSVNAANNSAQRASEAHFYTDSTVIADYQQYISHLLNHVNPYTGLAYKNDPAIMAWETGNEIWTANPTWTQQIAYFIKHRVGARQLVADGTAADGMRVANAAVKAPDVDIVGGHFYPVDTAWATQDAGVAAANNKAYVIGEYAWTDQSATSRLATTVEGNTNIAGAMLWTLMPYREDGKPEAHDDGYAFYNPGTSPSMSAILAILIRHAKVLSGR